MNSRKIGWRARVGSALLLGLGLCVPLNAAPPPDGDHELCRTLVRSLDDGAALTVERCWSIRFTADGTATRVAGAQSSAKVDAPAVLAALARMEEERVENGMFPLVLGADGLVDEQGVIAAGETLEEAKSAAFTIIAQIEPEPVSADAMRSFVAQVASASAQYMGRIPRDLFYPVAIEIPEIIPVALPDGSTGSVTIEQSAITDPGSGLLISARRSIITEAAGTANQSVETWTLTPAN